MENITMIMDDESKELIDRLKEIRNKNKISQLELSLRAGVTQSYITQIEKYQKAPTITTLVKLCKALDIRLSTLFNDVDYDKESKKDEIIKLIKKYL